MIYIPKTPLYRSEQRDVDVVCATNEHLLNPSIKRVSYHPLATNLFDLCIERVSGVAKTHSKAVFVTSDPNQNSTREYGTTYYFFPRRPFVCAWVDVPHDIQQLSTQELRTRFGLPHHIPAVKKLMSVLLRESVQLDDIEDVASEYFQRCLLNTIPTHALDDVTPHQTKTEEVYELRVMCTEYVLINVEHVDGTYQEFIDSGLCERIVCQSYRSAHNHPLAD